MRSNQTIGIRFMNGDRFFNKNVPGEFQRPYTDRGVRVMWGRNQYRIRLRRSQKVVRGGKTFGRREPSEPFGLFITYRSQFAARDLAIDDALGMDGPHGPESDDSEFYCSHRDICISYPLTPPLSDPLTK